MHFIFPSYSGNKLFKASRLSPCIILFPLLVGSVCSPFSAVNPYLCSKTLYGTSWWWLTTLSFPIQLSVGILFLFFIRDYQFFHVNVQNFRYFHQGFQAWRSEEHTSELQSRPHLVCRLLLEKKKLTLVSPRLSSLSSFFTLS